jgi:hypothetical protein
MNQNKVILLILDNKKDKKDDTPEPAKIDMKEIFNIEHRIEVVPKSCKLNRYN